MSLILASSHNNDLAFHNSNFFSQNYDLVYIHHDYLIAVSVIQNIVSFVGSLLFHFIMFLWHESIPEGNALSISK